MKLIWYMKKLTFQVSGEKMDYSINCIGIIGYFLKSGHFPSGGQLSQCY